MSNPFGGHPTFAQYLQWTKEEEGCTIQTGVRTIRDGQMVSLTIIQHPNGNHVMEPGTSQHDYLVPTQIAYLDRRLGIASPFFSIDDSGRD